jgi:hypothetical protein
MDHPVRERDLGLIEAHDALHPHAAHDADRRIRAKTRAFRLNRQLSLVGGHLRLDMRKSYGSGLPEMLNIGTKLVK